MLKQNKDKTVDENLNQLHIRELIRILRHVHLGKEHLLTHLKPSEFNELLRIGQLATHQHQNVRSDKQEKIGNIGLVLNTILTSCLGAWLGFAGFSGMHLNNGVTIIIILAALMIGATMARLSYRLTYKQAIESIVTHRLFNAELEIITLILTKRAETEIKFQSRILRYLAMLAPQKMDSALENLASLKYLIQDNKLDNHIKLKFDPLFFCLKNPEFKAFYSKVLANFRHDLEKISAQLCHNYAIKKISRDALLQGSFSSADLSLNTALTNASYIRVLTKPDLPAKKLVPRMGQWFNKNALGIAVSLLPTILGGFASMFVFLDGIPDMLRAYGLFHKYYAQHSYEIKVFSLSCAFLITSYLGYSNLHTNYKAFKRARQLDMMGTRVAEGEEKMLQQVSVLHSLIKMSYILKQIKLTYDSINLHLSTQVTETEKETELA